MTRNVGNPNHSVVREVEQQWHKLCAIALFKMGVTELVITPSDLDLFIGSGRANIVVDTRGGVNLTLRLVSDQEGDELARREGGRPQ